MVFDGVVGPADEHLGHLCPFVAVSGVGEEEDPLFVVHPFLLADAGVEVVMPALPALLAQAALDGLGDEGPPLGAVLLDQPADQTILGLRPGLLLEESEPIGVLLVGVSVVLLGDLLLVYFFYHHQLPNLKITAIYTPNYYYFILPHTLQDTPSPLPLPATMSPQKWNPCYVLPSKKTFNSHQPFPV